MTKHNHYFKDVSHLQQVDVYRILELFEVTCPVAQHIVKKALAAGKRGAKSPARDMQDIVDSAQRWLAMREEDAKTPRDLDKDAINVGWGSVLSAAESEQMTAAVREAVTRSGFIKTSFIPEEATRPTDARHNPLGFVGHLDAAYNLTKGAA
jgi:hypothetical protein